MSRQVAANLDNIIAALEADGEERRQQPVVLTRSRKPRPGGTN